MPDKKYRRSLSVNERMPLASARQGSPKAFILAIEGIGDIPDKAMEKALKKVSVLYPVCRSKISGFLKTLHWEESDKFPPFIRKGSTTYPFGKWPLPEEKKIYSKKMNPKKEPPVAVYSLSDGQRRRFYFKIHHSSMDGVAAHLLIYDFFKILRSEDPVGPTKGPETINDLYDATLPNDFFEKRRQEFLKNRKLKSKGQGKEGGSILFNGVYEGKHIIRQPSKDNQVERCSLLIPSDKIKLSKLNGKMISAVMDALRQLNPGLENKRFKSLVGVDLRYLMPGLRKTSNLTGLIAVELDNFFDMPIKKGVLSINNDIKEQIKNGWALPKYPSIISWIPLRVLRVLIFIFRKIIFYRKIFPYYFGFSNMGRYELSNLSTENFKARRIFTMPVYAEIFCPLFVVMTTHDNGVELVCTTDTSKEALNGFVDLLEERIASLEKEWESEKG